LVHLAGLPTLVSGIQYVRDGLKQLGEAS